MVNTATELLPGNTKICDSLALNKETIEGLFEDYIQTGIKKGEVNKNIDPKAMASMLFIHYNGIKVISKIRHDRKELLSTVQLMLSLLD
ncbi:TetR family transcriptional regulator C-terminal domain-containing protein [Pricia sp.]|uniref:TetR family transcriptional regulator C-terminal domain-containing protein n=1 Tax=Pricia sp. TaxID=2268138 RepID=UPI0035931352